MARQGMLKFTPSADLDEVQIKGVLVGKDNTEYIDIGELEAAKWSYQEIC